MSDNKMTEIIRASIDSIKSSFDANTVTGDPITTPNGTVIIPVSKLSVGFATGGVDYLGKNNTAATKSNFGGGGGTGVTVTPVAFIVVSPNGNAEMLSIANPQPEPKDTVSQIISAVERSPELIEKFKEIFSKKKDKSEKEAEGEFKE
ncbi:MAG: sporulation protein YtfJ [Ruminococcaceae bacterium]|nr:sporulation protein YtfJ [Oscillospiraceae bacterium]